ncbi:uncharacterized protein C1orf112-like [Pomacea canaliculata]|nr:uncharacterized protein C1orf112-like [Pomacea canaliculata]
MILDNLVQCSEEQEDIWFQRHMMSSGLVASHYHTLLSAIFRSLELCHVEVCLPVYLPSSTHIDSPQRYVSLYQFVLNHICEYLKCRSDRVFKAANKELLSVLLKMHPTSSLAAADCLYFIARSGPTALRWHYAHLLMTLNQEFHKAMPVGHPISSLSSLVSRVINLLTSDQQVKLLSVFPPSDNISLWVDVNLDNMAPGSAGEAVEVLVPCCLKTLHNFRQQTTPTISNAAIVIPSLKCLENILRHGQTASLLTPQQGAMVLELVSALWRSCPIEISFTDQSSKGQDVTQLYLAELLSVTSCIVDQLETKLLFKILQIINKAVKGSPSDGFVLTVVHLLQHLGPVKIPPSFEQGQMLRKIADTFATVLSHQRAEVRHCAMVAFTKFAEQTSHEAVVPECLAQQEGLKDRMVAFLQEIPHNHENRKFDTIAFLRKQKQDLQRKMTEDFNSYTGPQLLSIQSMEPLKKRQRQDTGPANQAELFQAALLKLEEAAAMFEEAERQGSIPDSVKTPAAY